MMPESYIDTIRASNGEEIMIFYHEQMGSYDFVVDLGIPVVLNSAVFSRYVLQAIVDWLDYK
jgi:hypothetical protein